MSKRIVFAMSFLVTCFCLTLHGSAQSPQYINLVLQRSPNGEKIAVGTIHGEVVIYDAYSGVALYTLQSEEGIFDLRWSPDGGRIAAVGYTGWLNVWDSATNIQLLSAYFPISTGIVRVNWSPDGTKIALTSQGEGSIIVNSVTGAELYHLQTGDTTDSDWSPSADLITADLVGLRVWENQTVVAKILGSRNDGTVDGNLPSRITISPDVGLIALYGITPPTVDTSGIGKVLQIYTLTSLDLLYSIALSLPEQTTVMRMEWSGNGQHIALSTTDGYVRIWDASLQFVDEVFIGNAGLAFDWIADDKIVYVTNDMTLNTVEIADIFTPIPPTATP